MPVPVQTRIPRLNIEDAWPTPAMDVKECGKAQRQILHTELHLPCPHRLGRIHNQAFGEVALNTADHVVIGGLAALANDTKCMIFHDRGAADSSEKTLLHAAIETKDRNSR